MEMSESEETELPIERYGIEFTTEFGEDEETEPIPDSVIEGMVSSSVGEALAEEILELHNEGEDGEVQFTLDVDFDPDEDIQDGVVIEIR